MSTEPSKPKRRLNADEKRALRGEQVRLFTSKIGRKAQKGQEPNDRKHDKNVGRMIEQLDPLELDRLMRGDEDADERG